MQSPNQNRNYQAEKTIELARHKRSYAAVQVCQCEDGQYRYSLDFCGSLRGFCGPIKADRPGYASLKAASDAGREEMLRVFPTPQAYDPESECRELVAMRAQIEAGLRQPSLF